MADSSTGDKTEKATPQKQRKAREEGQVVRSRDLATAIGILVSLKLLVALMPGYLEDLRSMFHLGFASLDGDGTLDNLWSVTFTVTMGLLFKMLLPLFIVPLAGVIGGLFPGGFLISTKNLMPKFSRMSPAANLGKLFTGRHYFELFNSIAKATALGVVMWFVTSSHATSFMKLPGQSFGEALLNGTNLMLDGIMAMCMVFLLFAFIDVPAQIFFFAKGQRMSKQDIKEEHKGSEGNPQIKQRIRQLQRQMARRTVRKTVPTADVVIVNPEHYAVALKYDEKRAEAPYVIAKGVDEMALYIREVAAEFGIETVPLPPLARAIYNTSQINQQIPMTLYKAVAQVLTYVLQIKAFRHGRRPGQPMLPTDLGVPEHLSEVVPT